MATTEPSKQCRTCKRQLSLAVFGPQPQRPDGHRDECRPCAAARARLWRKQNIDKARKQAREYVQRQYAADPTGNRDKQREYRKRNPAYIRHGRKSRLLKGYMLTMSQYDAMLESQGSVCAICRKPESIIDHRSGRPNSLAVDHDHETGRVRGLLCARCNIGIGRLRHDPVILQRAIDAVNDFTRMRMREDGFFRRLMPPLALTNDELDRSTPPGTGMAASVRQADFS